KTLQQGGIIGYAGGDGLEGYQAIDDRVAGTIHDSHRAMAQFSKDFVFSQLLQITPVFKAAKNRQKTSNRALADRNSSTFKSYITRNLDSLCPSRSSSK